MCSDVLFNRSLFQTLTDKDSESPDSSVSSISGRTNRQRTVFFLRSGRNQDKGEKRTGRGQCCPPTSDSNQKITSDLVRERNRWINESIYG